MKRKKICPRCKERYSQSARKCDVCGLVFSKLDSATNAQAKKLIKEKKTDYVLLAYRLPYDVNKIKLLICGIFGGLFGLHQYYVGRYTKGICYSVMFFISILGALNFKYALFPSAVSFIVNISTAVLAIMWLFDVVNILFGKFRVPVALDTTNS